MKKIKSRKFKKRNKKILKCLLCLLFFIIVFNINNVKAGANDSYLERNYMSNVYVIVDMNGIKSTMYSIMYEMNDKIVYSIEINTDIIGFTYHSTNDFSILSLTKEQIEYIRLVSYYGYGYEKHDDYKYYMAAQEIIWEYLGNGILNVEWGNKLDLNAERINIDIYKEEILYLLECYNSDELEIKDYYLFGDEIRIEGGNNYELVSSNCSSVRVDGDDLIILVGDKIGKEEVILKRKDYYDYESELYYMGNSKKFISNGNYYDDIIKLSFDIKGNSFLGRLIDKNTGSNEAVGQASLEGAKYELYNDNKELLSIFETDKNGNFRVDNINYGNYCVRQIIASEGYLMNDEEVCFDFIDDSFELVLIQEVIGNVIEIRKVYGYNGNYVEEEKILFEIYDNNGELYEKLITDEFGIGTVWLPYGGYKIHQSNTNLGYLKVDDFQIEIKENISENIVYNLVNEFVMCKVKINTLEVNSNNKINSELFSYRIRRKGDNEYLEYNGKNIFETNELGEVLIPISLGYGNYILEQVSAPNGVLENDKLLEFEINEKSVLSFDSNELIILVDFYNEFLSGKIKIKALEEKFYIDVNNYWFEEIVRENNKFLLVADGEIVVNNNIVYKKGDYVYEEISDSNGILFIDKVPLGDYCVIDEFGNEKTCFKLEYNEELKFIEKELEFVKKLNKGDIIITNISTYGESIKESIFEVLDYNDNVIYTGITNDEGIIKVNDVLVGDYCIRQKSIGVGFKKTEDKICFNLEKDKKIQVVNDLLVKQAISVPNTISSFMGIYEVLLYLFMILIGVVIYKKIFFNN